MPCVVIQVLSHLVYCFCCDGGCWSYGSCGWLLLLVVVESVMDKITIMFSAFQILTRSEETVRIVEGRGIAGREGVCLYTGKRTAGFYSDCVVLLRPE